MVQSLFRALTLLGIIALAPNALAADYIVKLKPQAYRKYASLQDFNGLKVLETHDAGDLLRVSLTRYNRKDQAKILALLMKRGDVEYVVENAQMHALGITNDPKSAEQWALENINAAGAWLNGAGSHNVVVAVVDTGLDTQHEDLKANLWTNTKEIPGNNIDDDHNGFVDDIHGWDFNQNDNDVTDETSSQNPGHGTHCAGIIGAVGNNGIGITGINQAISIMPLRFLDKNGSGDLFSSTKAIDYAVANGAQVISASWGAAIPQSAAQPIVDAIKRAGEKGVIFVAAAANDGTNNDTRAIFPANTNLDNVISVAATDKNNQKPQWSNFGRAMVHVAAPGADILSTIPGGYSSLSGTSMATPLVAGLIGLMKSHDLSLTAPQAKAILQQTGADMNIEDACHCRIDAAKAIQAVVDHALVVVPDAATLKVDETLKVSAFGGQAPYRFSSSNPEVASLNDQNELKALKEGEVQVVVEDAAGNKMQSKSIWVVNQAPSSGGGECPFEDPLMCMVMCIISPDLEWCQGMMPPGMPELPEIPGSSTLR